MLSALMGGRWGSCGEAGRRPLERRRAEAACGGSALGARLAGVVVVVALALALPAGALAQASFGAATNFAAADRAAQRYIDVRDATRASVARRGAQSARPASARSQAAHTSLRNQFGRQSHLQVDAITGTPRSFQRLDGALTGPDAGSPASVAMRYARTNAAALGLSDADFSTLASSPRCARAGRASPRCAGASTSTASRPTTTACGSTSGAATACVSVQGAPVARPRASARSRRGCPPSRRWPRCSATSASRRDRARDARARRAPAATRLLERRRARLVLFQLGERRPPRLEPHLPRRARPRGTTPSSTPPPAACCAATNLTKFAVHA